MFYFTAKNNFDFVPIQIIKMQENSSKIIYWFIFFATIVSIFYFLIQHESYHFEKQQSEQHNFEKRQELVNMS